MKILKIVDIFVKYNKIYDNIVITIISFKILIFENP